MFEFAIIGFLFYLLPTIVAVCRDHQSRMAIFVLNLVFGWTMIGWIAAFIWSLTGVYDYYRGVPARPYPPYPPPYPPRW